MVEIRKILLLTFSFSFISSFSLADIYQTSCKTIGNKNSIRSLSIVFSYNRNSVVINKVNGKKSKYKINISNINDKDKFIFNASDEFYTVIFNPKSSYIIKNNSNTSSAKINLINKDLDEIQINCTNPKIIKKEEKTVPNETIDTKEVKLDEKKLQDILKKLKNNENIQNQDLNEIMKNIDLSKNDTKINPEQLQELLKSKSMMGKLTSKDTLNKLKSEEFLLMIKDEIKKLIKK